jgi:valyl-tRNA synthetase
LLLNGNVLAPDGKKMSKSLGNVVVPDELLTKYSADAVRQWVALSGALARDRPFRHEDIQHAQTFINKLWNASKFVEKSLEGYESKAGDAKGLHTADKWILSRLSKVLAQCEAGYENFDFHIAMNAMHEFVWHEFCDYYLEYVKHRLYNPEAHGEEGRRAAQHTLRTVLYSILRAFFPIAPHACEEIYQNLFAQSEGHKSLAIAPFPIADAKALNEESEKIGALMNRITADVRTWKNAHKLPLNAELQSISVRMPKEEARIPKDAEEDLLGTVRSLKLIFSEGDFGVECA